MSKKNIFITGISGCVGHYVWDEIKDNPDYHLYLLVRNLDRLRFKEEALNKENVTIIQGSVDHLPQQEALLKQMHYVLHMATDWGGDMNYEHTIKLFELLDPKVCEKVLYFSTASILGKDNKPIQNAEEVGTAYIRRKWLAYQKLPELKIFSKMKVIFPTLIFGGDKNHPFSHTMVGLPKALKFVNLVRFFSFDGSFHYIHAADIAQMVAYMFEHNVEGKDFVFGMPPITFNEIINALCKIAKKKILFRITIKSSFIMGLARVLRLPLNSWDIYCLKNPHLRYKSTQPEDFGLHAKYDSIDKIISIVLEENILR